MLVRPSFFIMGLNFHRLPQSIIQLDLKLLSPQKLSSEAGTVSAVAQVAEQQASSLDMADGQMLATTHGMCACRCAIERFGPSRQCTGHVEARGSLPITLSPVVWRDAESMSPGLLSQQCSQLILFFVNAT